MIDIKIFKEKVTVVPNECHIPKDEHMTKCGLHLEEIKQIKSVPIICNVCFQIFVDEMRTNDN